MGDVARLDFGLVRSEEGEFLKQATARPANDLASVV
jgi:hypothetical protein